MADPTKRELGAALLQVLGSPITLPLGGASPEAHAAARGKAEFIAGMRLTRPEPAKPELDDAEHERAMVAFSVRKLRERADAAEEEASEAWTARDTKRETELRSEAERLRATADRHEATQRARVRARGAKP